MKKLAIITTHPVQYNSPLFRLLTERGKINIKVFYTWGPKVLNNKYDPGFNKIIEWDIPLLDGYNHHFVYNISKHPGSHHFNGIINPSLVQEIKVWNADAVLVLGWNFRSHLQCMRFFYKKIPVFFIGDSTLLDETKSRIKSFFKKIILKWIYAHVDKALYVGINNKAYFLNYGLKESQLLFIPHAIENERFDILENINFRQKLGISDTDTIFLFAGKFEPKKNPEMLIEAFLELNNPHAYLVMVGNGQSEDRLKNKCICLDNSIRNRIKFMDFQNQSVMPAIYKMADVLVLPSKGPGETWGLAVNEAMASGRGVLVSDKCGCTPDLVIEGITGYSFKSGNLSDLISKMKLMLNKEKTKIMGLQANEFIKSWSFENFAIAIESLFIK